MQAKGHMGCGRVYKTIYFLMSVLGISSYMQINVNDSENKALSPAPWLQHGCSNHLKFTE